MYFLLDRSYMSPLCSVLTQSKVSLNFSGFFEKLAEMFQSIGYVSPILAEFQELFSESSGLRESLSGFYAVVVEFCTESLQFLKKECRFDFLCRLCACRD